MGLRGRVKGSREGPGSGVCFPVDPALVISADRLTVSLVVPAGAHLSLDDLRRLLVQRDVHAGLEPGALLAATRPSGSERTLAVAHGRPPRPGSDGRVELLIAEPVSAYGEGTVDLHELHHFREIEAGTPLARLTPPTAGEPGVDVHGRMIVAQPGKETSFGALLGPGCVVDDQDPTIARAEAAGIYQRFTRGGRPFVQVTPEVRVAGDIDMTIGNISSHHPVVVAGDVHATFSLKSRAAITINGSVEDARVSARGDLVVKGGILQGITRVKAHGDLSARHIESREVKARHVHVDYAIHFARIRSTGHVTAKEIVGGEVLAAGSVTCDTLGDPDGRPTLVQVGINPFEEALVSWAHQRGDHLDRELAGGAERCRMLAHRVQTRLSAGEDHAGEDHTLRIALAELEDLRRLAARCKAILAAHPEHREQAKTLVEHARVVVRRTVNPGTVIRIGEDAELVVKTARPGGTFWRSGNRVLG